jgi:phosphate transport system substrate-binding protein
MSSRPHKREKKIVRSVVIGFLLFTGTCFAQVKIAGDDTLILLGQRISQIYRQSRPVANVTVGGQSAASNAEIVQSVRKPAAARTFPIGVQSVVVYVNRANPVSELTVAQVRAIFMGEITNWKTVGGKDAQIKLYAGESTSGTLAFFQETVLKGEEPYPFWGKSTTKELVETIEGDVDGIGYASFSPSPKVKPIRMKAGSTSLAVEPSMDNIRTMRYPLGRFLYWSVKANAGTEALSLAEWLLSSQGQLVVESVGFEPVTAQERTAGLGTLRKGASGGAGKPAGASW